MRRLLFKKSTMLAILTVGFGILGFQIYGIYREAENKLAQIRSRLKEQNIVTFEKVRLNPHPQSNLVSLLNFVDDVTQFSIR